MSQAAIEAILKQKIGLDPKILGSSAIASAVQRRLADCGLSDLKTYLMRLQISTEELNALIEAVIVPETWFFRDSQPFVFLSHYIKSEWLPNHPNSILRILSVPCSTGEEPYSIAIALQEIGLSSKKYCIDAVDISQTSLNLAQRAIYSQNSFRGKTLDIQKRYFTNTVDGYQLSESVRRSVNFIHGNLLDYPLHQKKLYDVIFCRNLLIYFDQAARKLAIQGLDRLLANNGLLFVGHSETRQVSSPKFVSVPHPLAFAFRKVEEKEVEDNKETGKQRSKERKFTIQNLKSKISEITPAVQQTADNKQTLLETAKILADEGQLNEAATLCETYLSQNRISAEAYVLLGEVHQAMGNDEQAKQCFQKAIYLQPNDYEALIHLVLLTEQHKDMKSAALIWQRIQRLQKD